MPNKELSSNTINIREYDVNLLISVGPVALKRSIFLFKLPETIKSKDKNEQLLIVPRLTISRNNDKLLYVC